MEVQWLNDGSGRTITLLPEDFFPLARNKVEDAVNTPVCHTLLVGTITYILGNSSRAHEDFEFSEVKNGILRAWGPGDAFVNIDSRLSLFPIHPGKQPREYVASDLDTIFIADVVLNEVNLRNFGNIVLYRQPAPM